MSMNLWCRQAHLIQTPTHIAGTAGDRTVKPPCTCGHAYSAHGKLRPGGQCTHGGYWVHLAWVRGCKCNRYKVVDASAAVRARKEK
jgi:hypothetical protein